MDYQELSVEQDLEERSQQQRFTELPKTELPKLEGNGIPEETFDRLARVDRWRYLRGWWGLIAGTALGLAIAAGSFAIAERQAQTEKESPAPAAATPSQTNRQRVTVERARTETVDRTLEATGTISPRDLLPILPEVAGLRIRDVLVDEGDWVEAGEVLAILDGSILETRLEQARAQAASADSSIAQAEAAVEQSLSEEQEMLAEVQRAEAGVLQAAAQLEQAEAGLAQARDHADRAEVGIEQAAAGVAQAKANLAREEANLEQASRELSRFEQLADDGLISQQDLDVRQTAVRTAFQQVNQAREGVRVAEADVLAARADASSARTDILNAQAEISRAEANLADAEARVGNVEAQVDTAIASTLASEANTSNAIANARNSEALVAEAETALAQTNVLAPAAGLIAERDARVGDASSLSSRLFAIVRDGELELLLSVPETQLPQVKAGASVAISSDADASIRLRGTIREIAPLVDETSRQATVKISLPPDDRLRAGMFLRGNIVSGKALGLTVPAQAVLPQADGSALVFAVREDDTARAITVETGELVETADLSAARIEIRKGLSAGDRIVVEGAAYLKDGDRIQIAP